MRDRLPLAEESFVLGNVPSSHDLPLVFLLAKHRRENGLVASMVKIIRFSTAIVPRVFGGGGRKLLSGSVKHFAQVFSWTDDVPVWISVLGHIFEDEY